jgi:hypothetical protein
MLDKKVYYTLELKKEGNWVPFLEDYIQVEYPDFKEVTEKFRLIVNKNDAEYSAVRILSNYVETSSYPTLEQNL